MLSKEQLKEALKKNIEWFENSGVMDPADGSWGVGERIVLTKDNEALERTYKSFPAYVEHDGYAVIEHRRPDCNFETALMFLLASRVLDEKKYYKTAENILLYLYRRSGMRNGKYGGYPLNVWRWANEKWIPVVYFDDNAWNCAIAFMIGGMNPELDKKFNLKGSALLLAEEIQGAFERQFRNEASLGDRHPWAGGLDSPHWGSLVCMALAFAYRETGDAKYKGSILKYHKYLDENKDEFTTSEHAYIVIGGAFSGLFLDNEDVRETAMESAGRLLAKQDSASGNIPSEWGTEAPTGENLVDTIYTMNWAVVGLHALCALSDKAELKDGFEKAMNLLLNIQDDSSEKYLKGCWRGMYDVKSGKWGGGNRYEGGADSIYSGWTNAPISMIAALEHLGESLVRL